MTQVRRLWLHTTRFFDVSPSRIYQRARVRALPVGVIGATPFLIAAWVFVFDYPHPHHKADVDVTSSLANSGGVSRPRTRTVCRRAYAPLYGRARAIDALVSMSADAAASGYRYNRRD